MGRNSWDYREYRGRRTVTDLLKAVVAVLCVLVVLGGVGLWLAQDYIVYTEDGAKLQLPFMRQEEEPQPPAEPLEEIQIHVDEVEEPETRPLRLFALPITRTEEAENVSSRWLWELSGDELALVLAPEAAQADGVILDMKDDQGAVYWPSQAPLAPVQTGELTAEDIRALTAREDGYTVARISCFKDNTLGRSWEYAILTNSGYLWTDVEGVRWASPTNEQVRKNLLAMLTELAELGFDEILLDNCGYPNRGNLGYIRQGGAYNLENLSTVISDFLQDAAEVLEPHDTVLSVRCSGAMLAGEDTRSGLTAQALEACAGRIWIAREKQDVNLPALLTLAGITDAQERLVETVTEFAAEEAHTQGLISVLNF